MAALRVHWQQRTGGNAALLLLAGGGVCSAALFLLQLILGIPEQALTLLHMAIEPILADGAILDKGRAMFLVAKCQVASAASYEPVKKVEGKELGVCR